MKIGENRLQIYNILNEYPLFDYFEKDKKELNVLIIGNGWFGTEVFKAVFWCGQYPDVKMHITVASADANDFFERLKDKLPGLKDFATFDGKNISDSSVENPNYANIRIKTVSFDNIQNNIAIPDELNVEEQDCAFISLGDNALNQLIADEVSGAERIKRIFTFTEDDTNDTGKIVRISDVPESFEVTNLFQTANNIHFLYSMKDNENAEVHYKDTSEGFFESFQKEFLEKDGEGGSLEWFLGGGYDADSSLANAIHLKYKLHFCGDTPEKHEKILKAVDDKNGTYGELVKWEHDRWNAYMITRGYRAPASESERERSLYDGFHAQKNDDLRLHDCIVPVRIVDWENRQLNVQMCRLDAVSERTKAYWEEQSRINVNDEMVSTQLIEGTNAVQNTIKHLLELGKAEKNWQNKRQINTERNLLNNYLLSIEMLKENRPGSYSYYCCTKKAALEVVEKYGLKKTLDKIHENTKPFQMANRDLDYYAYDAMLIDFLPVVVEMEKKRSAFLVVEDFTYNDIVLPWLSFPERIVLIGEEKTLTQVKERVESFISFNGDYSSIKQENVKYLSADRVFEVLDKTVKDGDYVCLSAHNSPAAVLAIGRIAEKKKVSVYRSRLDNKNHCLCGQSTFPKHLQAKEVTVDRVLEVSGCSSCGEDNMLIPENLIEGLKKLFWEISQSSKYKTEPIWQNDIHQKKALGNNSTTPYEFSKDPEIIDWQERFLEGLSNIGCIRWNRKSNVISKEYADPYVYLSVKDGTLFETIVFYRLLSTGLFSDLKQGTSFYWGDRGTNNEIDVAGIYNNVPVFVSCKISKEIEPEHVYEINTIAKQLNAIPIIATKLNKNDIKEPVKERAKDTGVALIGAEVLQDPDKLKEELKNFFGMCFK